MTCPAKYFTREPGVRSAKMKKSEQRGQGCCIERNGSRKAGTRRPGDFETVRAVCLFRQRRNSVQGRRTTGLRAPTFSQSRRNDFPVAAFIDGSLSLKKTTPRMAPALPLLGPFLWASSLGAIHAGASRAGANGRGCHAPGGPLFSN